MALGAEEGVGVGSLVLEGLFCFYSQGEREVQLAGGNEKGEG